THGDRSFRRRKGRRTRAHRLDSRRGRAFHGAVVGRAAGGRASKRGRHRQGVTDGVRPAHLGRYARRPSSSGAQRRRGVRERAARRTRRRVLPRSAGVGGASLTEVPRSIRGAADLLRSRRTSALELTEAALERSHADRHNAWLHLCDERARAQARTADARLKLGDATALTGIPWACKDIIGTKAIPTTAGSRILEGYVPPYSATVVERLDAEGAVMIGKTNLDEFAMGSSNENSAFGAVKKPWCAERVPGGSSGGSAVAVAASEVLFALGTDTGGSIRQPAALTGVVGMKPTYGRVPRWGVVAFASSLDQVGPFATTVEDVAIVCEAIFGKDPNDATMVTDFPNDDLRRDLDKGVKGMRLGVPKE